jgi:hypothetical protein
MRLSLPLVLLLLAGCAVTGPAVVPVRSDPAFKLSNLKGAAVAVWPVPVLQVDDVSARLVADVHPSQGAFLDELGRQFSTRLIKNCQRGSLGSEQVVALLTRQPATAALLDTEALLGQGGGANRFLAVRPPELSALADVEQFRGLGYAVVFRDLTLGELVTVSDGGGGMVMGGRVSGGTVTGGTVVGGGSYTSHETRARLRLAVVDLRAGKVAWDGAVMADTSNFMSSAGTLQELEEQLVRYFLIEVGVESLRKRRY